MVLKKLTVRGLLTVIFVLIVSSWFALRVYQQNTFEALQESIRFVAAEAGRSVQEVSELRSVMESYHSLWLSVGDTADLRERRDLRRFRARFDLVLGRIGRETVEVDGEVKMNDPRVVASADEISSLARQYFESAENASQGLVMETQRLKVVQIYNQILTRVDGLKTLYEEASDRIEDQGEKIIRLQRDKDLVFLAVSLSGLTAVTVLIWFLLGRPLTELAKGVKRLSVADWGEPLRVRGFGEIAELIKAFNRMAETIKHQKEELVEEATTDELTGLLNFRAFQDRVQTELARSVRSGKPLSLILADIDHFKKYNDTKGHLAGNEALKALARVLKKGSRSYDLVARFGGEEFAVVLPETDVAEAAAIAERLRSMAPANGHELTISCGVAVFPKEAADLQALIACADKKLYRAKEEGRNRVIA